VSGAAEALLAGDMPGPGISAALAGLDGLDLAEVVLEKDAGAVGGFGQDEPGAVGAQAGIGRGEVRDRQAQKPGDNFSFIVPQVHVARLAATGAALEAGAGGWGISGHGTG